MSVARYTLGTSQINGGGAVHGSGTLWASAATPGDFYAPTVAGPFYEIVTVTDDDDIIIEPAPATTGAGQSYVIFQVSPLRGSIAQNNILLTAFRTQLGSILTVSGADKTITLNKTATTDNAGLILQQGGTSLFQTGLFGNGLANTRYQVQYLVTATWTPAISVDPTTGKVGFGVAAATQILDAVATSAALALWDNAAAATGKGGALLLQASNASSARTTFASLNAYVTTTTAGAEVGDLVIKTMRAGTLTEAARFLGAGSLVMSNGVQFSGPAATGFYADSSNVAIRSYTGASSIYFQNASGATVLGSWNTTKLDVALATASTSTTTGALTVAGGVGVGGAGFFGGALTVKYAAATFAIDSNTDSTSALIFKENGAQKWLMQNDFTSDIFYIIDAGSDNGVLLSQNASSWAAASDRRLPWKRNRESLSVLTALDGFELWNFVDRNEVGVIAQEFYKCFPQLVRAGADDDNRALLGVTDPGAWSVMYERAGIVALGGVKELKSITDDHERRIAALESRIH